VAKFVRACFHPLGDALQLPSYWPSLSQWYWPFVRPITKSGYGPARFDHSTSIGFDDIDGDGILDAWWCDPDDNQMEALWGNEQGKFASEQVISIGDYEVQGAFFDVDEDGDFDIVLKTGAYVNIRSATPTVTAGVGEFLWIELEKR
jgi:hypothetical protein